MSAADENLRAASFLTEQVQGLGKTIGVSKANKKASEARAEQSQLLLDSPYGGTTEAQMAAKDIELGAATGLEAMKQFDRPVSELMAMWAINAKDPRSVEGLNNTLYSAKLLEDMKNMSKASANAWQTSVTSKYGNGKMKDFYADAAVLSPAFDMAVNEIKKSAGGNSNLKDVYSQAAEIVGTSGDTGNNVRGNMMYSLTNLIDDPDSTLTSQEKKEVKTKVLYSIADSAIKQFRSVYPQLKGSQAESDWVARALFEGRGAVMPQIKIDAAGNPFEKRATLKLRLSAAFIADNPNALTPNASSYFPQEEVVEAPVQPAKTTKVFKSKSTNSVQQPVVDKPLLTDLINRNTTKK